MKCLICGGKFEFPIIVKTSQASMFGCADIYNDNYIEMETCPYCGSEEIEGERHEHY